MNALIKRIKSKTYWLGAAVVAAGFLDQNTQLISQLIPEQYRGLAVSLIGVAVWVLREVTTQPLSDK